MNNLKYTIELDAKGKLIPELKITRQRISVSVLIWLISMGMK